MEDQDTIAVEEETEEGTAPDAAAAAADGEPEAAPAGEIGFFTMLSLLPQVVRGYLVSKDITKKREEIYAKFGLDETERNLALYAELEVFFGDCPLDEFPDRLFGYMPWEETDEERARKLAIEILGRVMLPAQAYVGDVPGLIKSLGGDVNAFPQDLLELRVVTFKQGAEEIGAAAAPAGLNEDLLKRLTHIIESRLRQVRDDQDVEEMLTKSKKTGGMELAESQAKDILDVIRTRSRMTKYVEAIEEPGAKPEEAAPGAEPVPEKQLSAAEIKKIYSGPAEEQEGIAKRLARFRDVTGSDTAKMRDAYYQVLYPPDLRPTDPMYVVAGALAFAEDGELADLLVEDERYKEIVRKYYATTEAGGAKADEGAGFDADPGNPVYMNLFLQLLFRGFGGFDERESARLGLRVTNLLKKVGMQEYDGLAVFDLEHGAFKWVNPVQFE